MALFDVSFRWAMQNEDPLMQYKTEPDAPPGAFAISGINSAKWPEEYAFIESLAQDQRAAELDPLSPEILFDSVWAPAWQGKYDAAKALARKALDLDPTNSIAQWAIGWIDIQAGKFSDAIPELQKAAAMESPRMLPDGSGTRMGRQAIALTRWRRLRS